MKDKLLNAGLTEEQAENVIAMYGDYIPRARFNEINEKYKTAKQELEQLEPSKNTAEMLQQQITDLKKAHAEELRRLKIENAVTAAITAAKGKNAKAIRALLELEKAELAEDGTVKGLAEQMEKLKKAEDSKFLFDPERRTLRGTKPAEASDRMGWIEEHGDAGLYAAMGLN